MFYIVAFDISDDRIRYRVAKLLKSYGYRVQKSVFECPDLTEKKFLTMKDRLERLIDFTTDSVRYYRQCRGCLNEFEFSGVGEEPEVSKFGVV